MTLFTLGTLLWWCTVINYGILIFWCITALKWDGLYNLCARIFRVPRERVDAINFAGIVFYKAAIILFNLVPLIAVWIVEPAHR